MTGPDDQYAPAVSPDGRFIAYVSTESERQEIYLRRFPAGEGRWQLSNNGGAYPRWNAAGNRLYFQSNMEVTEIDLDLKGSPVLGTPRRVFARAPLSIGLPLRWPAAFDVSPDGKKFVVHRDTARTHKRNGVVVVQNWLEEFREKK